MYLVYNREVSVDDRESFSKTIATIISALTGGSNLPYLKVMLVQSLTKFSPENESSILGLQKPLIVAVERWKIKEVLRDP